MSKKIDTKITLTFLIILAFILGSSFYFLSYFIPGLPPILPIQKLKGVEKFASEEEFKSYLEEAKTRYLGAFGIGGLSEMIRGVPLVEKALPMAPMEGIGGGAPERISETTVQVPGIDEPDIVKIDGKEIYFSRQGFYYWRFFEEIIPPPITGEIKLIKAFPPEDLATESKIEKTGDLLLKDKILIIFSGQDILGYDVSNPKSPTKKWELELEDNGFLVGARLYKDKIYFVTRNRVDEFHPCPIKPLTIEGKPLTIECAQIYHPIIKIPIDVTYNAFILNPSSGKIEKNISFVGSSESSIVYMSENGIYVTYSYLGDFIKFFYDFLREKCQDLIPSWVIEKIGKLQEYDISDQAKFTEFTIIMERYQSGLSSDERLRIENELSNRMEKYYKEEKRDLEKTGIVKIDLKDFNIVANGEIPGQPLNQFSLDEYQNYLRVATTIGGGFGFFGFWGRGESANDAYVLDKNLKIVGQVQDLGLTERIYSVRFIEDKGYIVTFRETDPFFVLDLSNPQKPELKGELKIPGFSSYLDPITKDIILGIGREGWQVKISLFDVSDPENPKELDKYTLDESWSDILQTHHAFLKDTKHEIFFLPGSRGGYIFSYQGNKLELKRAVSDIAAKRAVYLNDYLYIIGENKLVVLNEINWEKVSELEY